MFGVNSYKKKVVDEFSEIHQPLSTFYENYLKYQYGNIFPIDINLMIIFSIRYQTFSKCLADWHLVIPQVKGCLESFDNSQDEQNV